MATNRTKSVRLGCLMGLLFFLAAGMIFVTRYQNATGCRENQPALKSLNVTIDRVQGQQLIEQSRQFAYQNSFRLDVVKFDETNGDIRLRMIRKDVQVIVRNPVDPAAFEIGFHNYDCIHPTTVADIDDLVNDFKSFISEIPNAAITEGQ